VTEQQIAGLGHEYTATGAVILPTADFRRLLEERKRLLEALKYADCGRPKCDHVDCADHRRVVVFAEESAP
jgi:hypothetical protein